MSEHLRAVEGERFEFQDFASHAELSLYSGTQTFGTMTVQGDRVRGNTSVVEIPTTKSSKALTLAEVTDFVRAMLPVITGLTAAEVLHEARVLVFLSVEGIHSRYRLSSERERHRFSRAASRTGGARWLCVVESGRSGMHAHLCLTRAGSSPKVTVGLRGPEWTAGGAAWLIDRHERASEFLLDPVRCAETLQRAFETAVNHRTLSGVASATAREPARRRRPPPAPE